MIINKKRLRKECMDNASKLLKNAIQYFTNKDYALATFFAITSLEETLKAGLVESLKQKLISEVEFKKIFYKHELKLLSKYSSIRFHLGGKKKNIVFPKYYFPIEKKKTVNNIIKDRNNALYVNQTYNGEIVIPSKIKKYKAEKYINMAKRELDWEHMIIMLKQNLKNYD